jgi:hypothetical protein
MDGMRMSSEEECVVNEEIGILQTDKRFRPNKKRIVAEREGKHSENEERDIGAIFQIKGSLHIEENICQLSPVEEDPIQIRLRASNP